MKKFAVLINENQVKLLSKMLDRAYSFPEFNEKQCQELALIGDMLDVGELQEYDAIGKDGIINDLCDDAFGLES